MWVAAQELPRSAAHPFYARLNQLLEQHFDGYIESLCQQFYADEGRPGLPPGRYFRLLLQRLADAGLVKGKTVGIDAATLEANAAPQYRAARQQ